MLKQEFEERIGRSVTEQEYVDANAMYMAAGDIDKDVFCREWKKVCMSPLVQGLFDTAYRLNKALQGQKLETKEAQEMISDAADAMLEMEQGLLDGGAVEHTTELLDRKAKWLVGAKEVVLRKIKMGMDLTERDRKYIAKQLG